METTWQSFIKNESQKPYFQIIKKKLSSQSKEVEIFPPKNKIMNAFRLTPFNKVKVVILGQDPYHGKGQAHGLSFSVEDGVMIPPSLKNVFKEIHASMGIKLQRSGNLERWANQGVLLLNSVLTVEEGKPASHKDYGWQQFTDNAIQKLNEEREGIVFMLWGNYAKEKGAAINRRKHAVLESAHPSPFSAHRGFFGCGHFPACNAYLNLVHGNDIDWS